MTQLTSAQPHRSMSHAELSITALVSPSPGHTIDAPIRRVSTPSEIEQWSTRFAESLRTIGAEVVMKVTGARSIVVFVAYCAAVPLVTQPVFAEGSRVVYAFETIDVPGATLTSVNANSTHAMAGEFDDPAGAHGFILSDGAFTQVGVPGASATVFTGINARGHLTGFYYDSQGFQPGFTRGTDVITMLVPPTCVFSFAFFLNSKDQVVGFFGDGTPTTHGFVWSQGVFTPLDVPGAAGTVAAGINSE